MSFNFVLFDPHSNITCVCMCVSHYCCVRLFVTPWTETTRLLCPWDSAGKNTGVGSHAPLQGIFWIQDGTLVSSTSCIGRQVPPPVTPPGKPLKSYISIHFGGDPLQFRPGSLFTLGIQICTYLSLFLQLNSYFIIPPDSCLKNTTLSWTYLLKTVDDPWLSNSGIGEIPWRRAWQPTPVFLGFPGGSAGTESTCNVGDLGLIPRLGRFPGEGNGNPLQYSCHRVAESQTRLSD